MIRLGMPQVFVLEGRGHTFSQASQLLSHTRAKSVEEPGISMAPEILFTVQACARYIKCVHVCDVCMCVCVSVCVQH